MPKAIQTSFLALYVLCLLHKVTAESCNGDENAVPGCGMGCVKKCSNYWRDDIVCTADCELNGCSCKDDYVYDENTKKCVNFWECSPVCGQHEVFSTCTDGGCYGARNCSEDLNTPTKCVKISPDACQIGCICEEGYLRNKNGVCVANDECSVNEQCEGANEFYDTCPPNCEAETCNNLGKVKECPPQAAVCKPRCRCAKGFLRNTAGECIPEKYCPKDCPENEYWSGCANGGCYGPRKCSQKGRSKVCVRLIEGACKGACLCKDDLLRNDEGVCVSPSQCPPSKEMCKANEVYEECPEQCPPRVCGVHNNLVDCRPQPVKGDPKCPPPACRCQNGFYQNPDGHCVEWEDCPVQDE